MNLRCHNCKFHDKILCKLCICKFRECWWLAFAKTFVKKYVSSSKIQLCFSILYVAKVSSYMRCEITDLDNESSLDGVKHLLGNGGGVSWGQLDLVGPERTKQSLLLVHWQHVATVEGAVEYPGSLCAVDRLHVNGDGAVQNSDNDGCWS